MVWGSSTGLQDEKENWYNVEPLMASAVILYNDCMKIRWSHTRFFFSLKRLHYWVSLGSFSDSVPDVSDGQWHRAGYHTFHCKLHSANHILPLKQPIRHFQSWWKELWQGRPNTSSSITSLSLSLPLFRRARSFHPSSGRRSRPPESLNGEEHAALCESTSNQWLRTCSR